MAKTKGTEEKAPITTHLYKSQIERLNRVARDLKVTKAVLFREAISQFLQKYEDRQLDIGIRS